jgi:hypothetical protein
MARNLGMGDTDESSMGLLAAARQSVESLTSGVNSKVKFFKGKFEHLSIDNIVGDFKEQAGEKMARKLKRVTGSTMDDMAPKCGQEAVAKCCEKYPIIEKADSQLTAVDMTENAIAKATETILSFKDEAFEFCDDIIDALMDSGSPIDAVLSAIRSIVVELLRALRSGITAATKAVLSIIPDACEPCCFRTLGIDLPALQKECYDSLVDTVEDFFKEQLQQRKVPSCFTDKIELNDISPDEEIGEPKSRARGKKPEQETMDGGDDDSDDGNDDDDA